MEQVAIDRAAFTAGSAKILPFTRTDEALQRDAEIYLNRLNSMIMWALHERAQVEKHPTEPCKRNGWAQVEMAKAMAEVCEGDPAEWAENLTFEMERDAAAFRAGRG